jgi:hypothetical protein
MDRPTIGQEGEPITYKTHPILLNESANLSSEHRRLKMSRAALSITVWGVYMIVAGLGFLLLPNTILPLIGFPTTAEVWIRVAGLLVVILGAYYFYFARNEVVPFFRVTIPGRVAFAVGVAALVGLGLSGPSLLLFGVLDLVGAIWTWWALRATA